MLKLYVPSWATFDATLTIPGPVVEPDDVRRLVKSYWQRLRRVRVAGFWRIELQERGQAHVHIYGWRAPDVDLYTIGRTWRESLSVLGPVVDWRQTRARARARRLLSVTGPSMLATITWKDGIETIVQNAATRADLLGAERHAARVRESPSIGWMAYVTAHLCKRKERQLGWKGRQWGYINKEHLRTMNRAPSMLTAAEYWRVARTLRRWKKKPGHFARRGKWQLWIEESLCKKLQKWATNTEG